MEVLPSASENCPLGIMVQGAMASQFPHFPRIPWQQSRHGAAVVSEDIRASRVPSEKPLQMEVTSQIKGAWCTWCTNLQMNNVKNFPMVSLRCIGCIPINTIRKRLINESSPAWYCFKLVWTFETPKKCHLRMLERLSRSLQASHVGLQLPPELLDMQGVSPTCLKVDVSHARI